MPAETPTSSSRACSTRPVPSSTGPSPTRSSWRPRRGRPAACGRSRRWSSTSDRGTRGSWRCSPTTLPSGRRFHRPRRRRRGQGARRRDARAWPPSGWLRAVRARFRFEFHDEPNGAPAWRCAGGCRRTSPEQRRGLAPSFAALDTHLATTAVSWAWASTSPSPTSPSTSDRGRARQPRLEGAVRRALRAPHEPHPPARDPASTAATQRTTSPWETSPTVARAGRPVPPHRRVRRHLGSRNEGDISMGPLRYSINVTLDGCAVRGRAPPGRAVDALLDR